MRKFRYSWRQLRPRNCVTHLQDSRVDLKVRVKTLLFDNFTRIIIGAKNVMRKG